MPIALTIAGSDPSGGAGIQSDLRTFAALGVIGVSVITALTVQNSQGVRSVHPISADLVAAQLEAVLEDTRPDAVKIGMLGGAAQVRVVADALRRFRPPNIVLDPVLASTGGVPLLDAEGRSALLTDLVPLCDLVTPNLDEAATLTGLRVQDQHSMRSAGEKLLSLGATAALVKGGHLAGEPNDLLLRRNQPPLEFQGERIETRHTHGTGCFLSATLAAYLAMDGSLEEMIVEAKHLLTLALREPTVVGQARGYPNAFAAVDTLSSLDRLTHGERLKRLQGVYVVTDPDLRPDRTTEETATAALAGGAKTLQLRHKRLSTPDLIRHSRQLCARTHQAGGLFIINDRVDVALASDADGVHLGPDDMPPRDARHLLGANKLIGVSTGTLDEARAAAPYASYFGVGAIFGTQTKGDAGEPVGLARIREIKAAFPHIPVVAIGGINRENIADVARAGADAAAVVSAVVAAPDMAEATRDLVRRFQRAKEGPPDR